MIEQPGYFMVKYQKYGCARLTVSVKTTQTYTVALSTPPLYLFHQDQAVGQASFYTVAIADLKPIALHLGEKMNQSTLIMFLLQKL